VERVLDLLQNFSKNPPSTNRILRIVIPIRTHVAHCYSGCKNSIPVQYRKVGELALVLKKMDNTKYNRITGNAMPNANQWPMHQAKRKPRLHTTPPKNGAKCAWNRISNLIFGLCRCPFAAGVVPFKLPAVIRF
jgi:hypothetical protein